MKALPSEQAVPQLLSRRTVLRHLGGLVLVRGGLAPLRPRLAALLPSSIVCLCLLVGLLVGCGASTSQSSGPTPSSTKQIIEFPIPTSQGSPKAITARPDGNLWFAELEGTKIGRITPSGTITEFPIPTLDSVPNAITAGPDGNLWFTEGRANKIGRITPSGTISEFSVPTSASDPEGITKGPDGNLWFTEWGANKIGRITPK
jgi:streptogramin lyase